MMINEGMQEVVDALNEASKKCILPGTSSRIRSSQSTLQSCARTSGGDA